MRQDTFNADFYVAAATVIPVLFLALTLQGSTYEQLLTYWQRVVKNALRMNKMLAYLCDLVIYFIAAIVPVSGFYGELKAMLALYEGRASNDTKQFVLFSTIILLAITAFSPAIRLMKTMGITTDAMHQNKDSEHSHHEMHEESDVETPESLRSNEESSER